MGIYVIVLIDNHYKDILFYYIKKIKYIGDPLCKLDCLQLNLTFFYLQFS